LIVVLLKEVTDKVSASRLTVGRVVPKLTPLMVIVWLGKSA
jgi:hypothetical protein